MGYQTEAPTYIWVYVGTFSNNVDVDTITLMKTLRHSVQAPLSDILDQVQTSFISPSVQSNAYIYNIQLNTKV